MDEATCGYEPAYYMINCSHVDHFIDIFDTDSEGIKYIKRIRGLKPNASRKSHLELNDSNELDDGNPEEFGRMLFELRQKVGRHLNVLSGCCGTDIRHLNQLIKWLSKEAYLL